MKIRICGTILLLAGFCLSTLSATGRLMDWSGPDNGDWFDAVNWTPAGIPAVADDVTLTTVGTVFLTNETPNLASFTMTGGTLVFSNWNTRLQADTIAISGGTVTLPVAFANNQMSNRVWFAGGTFDLGATAQINVDGCGFRGGQGPGAGLNGTSGSGGGGHGGRGNDGYNGGGGVVNGTADNPGPGSGGGHKSPDVGGEGGGAVRIEMSGAITLDGTISANGVDSDILNNDNNARSGGGAGGGVVIAGDTISGTSGVIRANGGYGARYGGSGGGGRIALLVDHTAQAALPKHRILLSTGSKTGSYKFPGDIGTLFASSPTGIDAAWMPHTGSLFLNGVTNWNVTSFNVANGRIRIADASFNLMADNDIRVDGSKAHLEFYGARLASAADLVLTNGGVLSVFSAATNGVPGAPDYGSLVEVTGTVHIASGSWIRSYSHRYNGGSPLFRMGSLNVAATGGFDADEAGFSRGITTSGDKNGYGPGKAASAWSNGGGAGYGGCGGRSLGSLVRGSVYGDPERPTLAGSGGASAGQAAGRQGGNGGGTVRLEIAGRLHLEGTLSANGGRGIDGGGGGGSGGSIFVQCRSFAFTEPATLSARGGNGQNTDAGGGGGGRIALWYGSKLEGELNYNFLEVATNSAAISATVNLAGGSGYVTDGTGEPGTFRLVRVLNKAGTVLLLR